MRAQIITTMQTMGPALAPDVMRDSYEEWEMLREDMIVRCEECHSESYTRRELEKGDDLLREADIAMAHLIDLANLMYKFRVIDDRTRFTIYREGTAHRFSAYMGGFHNSPKYAWDEGYLALAQTLIGERDAAVGHVFNSLGVVLGVIGIALISWYWYRNRN